MDSKDIPQPQPNPYPIKSGTQQGATFSKPENAETTDQITKRTPDETRATTSIEANVEPSEQIIYGTSKPTRTIRRAKLII